MVEKRPPIILKGGLSIRRFVEKSDSPDEEMGILDC